MLDEQTKRRINNARDILVGKIPVPSAQVEQITIALIYKFMDDMDFHSIELGGKREFFTGEFEKYSWSNLMAPGIGGFETLAIYGEALQRMTENPTLPELFRTIFKNAYLPYRDPETLRSFLKEINGFEYDNSERLGDAFEYLLAVLGSQGDAGQFRTPRHIIDFMVDIADPKKNDKVLDPACGTAGFLISAYKHILKHNSSIFNPEQDKEAFEQTGVNIEELSTGGTKNYQGDKLTTRDRDFISKNIIGYDISPDMVRLSLVNMYLHGFKQPHISEYDTLTSEDKWNEYADVILANPPFMTPKGGIKPHKRFEVQAKRSEVLFVDYIAEHLTSAGRAAVIVPEGIIFQSQGAYKQLRKVLVEGYLYAVVSLPGGVFQPYSGVKTSILFIDKALSKRTDKILFVNIENDGFNLGAQRRPIDKNDLPDAVRSIKRYIESIKDGGDFDADLIPNITIVEKERIAAEGDYNLSGQRYVAVKNTGMQKWPMVRLGDVCEKISKTIKPSTLEGNINYIGLENIESHTGNLVGEISSDTKCIKSLKNMFEKNDILYGKLRPNLNKVYLCKISGICSTDIYVLRCKKMVIPKYLDLILRLDTFNKDVLNGISGAQLPRVTYQYMCGLQIPLPTLEVQREIVGEIEGYQKIIDGCEQVVKSWKPQIDINPDWPVVRLGDVCDVRDGTHDSPKYVQDGFPLVTSKNIKDDTIDFSDTNLISKDDLEKMTTQEFFCKFVQIAQVDPPLIGHLHLNTFFLSAIFHRFPSVLH